MPKGIKGFQKGYIPHNKEVRGYTNSGSFKKGHKLGIGKKQSIEHRRKNSLAHIGLPSPMKGRRQTE